MVTQTSALAQASASTETTRAVETRAKPKLVIEPKADRYERGATLTQVIDDPCEFNKYDGLAVEIITDAGDEDTQIFTLVTKRQHFEEVRVEKLELTIEELTKFTALLPVALEEAAKARATMKGLTK
jgi:hypothetical protein